VRQFCGLDFLACLTSYCTVLAADGNTLGSSVMFAQSRYFIVAPCAPIVLPSLLLLLVTLVVITFISYVGVYGKGFPVDFSLCIYLIFFSTCLVRRGFLICYGWCVVGPGPE